MDEGVAKGAFLLNVRPLIYAIVHAVLLSSTEQGDGITDEGMRTPFAVIA